MCCSTHWWLKRWGIADNGHSSGTDITLLCLGLKKRHSASKRRVPPLTRGTLRIRLPAHARSRFIPAHAGNTGGYISVLGSPAVHPRSRGEHFRTRSRRLRTIGSSPLTWGTLFLTTY
ncbi:hypothetical protein GFGA_1c0078 [Gluconobacter frateurii NBRC 103465]|nr:hypothetical protein GFGA_1c0078 [Gluconobacter frateurii NBRC 103465]